MRLERVKGIEPSSQPWEGHILPLNHTRAWMMELLAESPGGCKEMFDGKFFGGW